MARETLSSILGNWQGVCELRQRLSSCGFNLPRLFTEEVCRFLGKSAFERVEMFWEEVAREYLRSAGNTDSESRTVHPKAYRSRYLDDLAKGVALESSERLSLSPDLDKFEQARFTDRAFREGLANVLSAAKDPELRGLSAPNIIVKSNRDKGGLLQTLAKGYGFDVAGDGSVRKAYQNVVVILSIDSGARGPLLRKLQWRSFLLDDAGEECFMRWDIVCPGADYYDLFDTAEEAVLGVAAKLQLASLFLDSLESAAEPKGQADVC